MSNEKLNTKKVSEIEELKKHLNPKKDEEENNTDEKPDKTNNQKKTENTFRYIGHAIEVFFDQNNRRVFLYPGDLVKPELKETKRVKELKKTGVIQEIVNARS